MFNYMKKGFGFAIEGITGIAVLRMLAETTVKQIVKDDEYLEYLKEKEPKLYKKVLELREKEEASE